MEWELNNQNEADSPATYKLPYQPTKPKDNNSAISRIHLTFVSTSSTGIKYILYTILIHEFKHLPVHLSIST